MAEDTTANAVELATELTVAWLGNQHNRISADDVPAFLRAMHETVTKLAGGSNAVAENASGNDAAQDFIPAVSVRKSLGSKDHIISLIDGKPYKTLRRHLSRHGLSPEQYRERYKLKADYPMVAESYSAARREMAKKIGLGSKGRGKGKAPQTKAPAPKRKRKILKMV